MSITWQHLCLPWQLQVQRPQSKDRLPEHLRADPTEPWPLLQWLLDLLLLLAVAARLQLGHLVQCWWRCQQSLQLMMPELLPRTCCQQMLLELQQPLLTLPPAALSCLLLPSFPKMPLQAALVLQLKQQWQPAAPEQPLQQMVLVLLMPQAQLTEELHLEQSLLPFAPPKLLLQASAAATEQ
jgi:hypothetical protein